MKTHTTACRANIKPGMACTCYGTTTERQHTSAPWCLNGLEIVGRNHLNPRHGEVVAKLMDEHHAKAEGRE